MYKVYNVTLLLICTLRHCTYWLDTFLIVYMFGRCLIGLESKVAHFRGPWLPGNVSTFSPFFILIGKNKEIVSIDLGLFVVHKH